MLPSSPPPPWPRRRSRSGGRRRGGGSAGARAFSLPADRDGIRQPRPYVTCAPGDASTLYVVEQAGPDPDRPRRRITGTLLDIRDRVRIDDELGLLVDRVPPALRAEPPLLRRLHRPERRHARRRVPRSTGVADPSTARELLFVRSALSEPQGRPARVRPRRAALRRHGRRRHESRRGDTSLGDPENRAQNPAARLGKLLRHRPAARRRAWQIGRHRPAQSVALLVRPPDGHLWIGDVGAATYEEIDFRPKAQIGSSRTTAGAATRGVPSTTRRSRSRTGKPRPARVRRTRTGAAALRGDRRLRLPRQRACRLRAAATSSATSAAGVDLELQGRQRAGFRGRTAFAGRVPTLSSFGEDARRRALRAEPRRRPVRPALTAEAALARRSHQARSPDPTYPPGFAPVGSVFRGAREGILGRRGTKLVVHRRDRRLRSRPGGDPLPARRPDRRPLLRLPRTGGAIAPSGASISPRNARGTSRSASDKKDEISRSGCPAVNRQASLTGGLDGAPYQ